MTLLPQPAASENHRPRRLELDVTVEIPDGITWPEGVHRAATRVAAIDHRDADHVDHLLAALELHLRDQGIKVVSVLAARIVR